MNERVIIVGGGVVGLAFSVALASRGIASTVLERTTTPGTIDRGDVIHAGAMSLLMKWGVFLNEYANEFLHVPEFNICDTEGRKLFTLNFAKDLNCNEGLSVIRHQEIERALHRAAVGSGLVNVLRGVTVTSLLQEQGRVVGVCTSEGVEHRGWFSVLAAGASTNLGESHFGTLSEHTYRRHFYNLLIDTVPGIPNAGRYYLSRSGVMIMVPLPNNKLRIGFQVAGAQDSSRYRTAESLSIEIRRRFVGFPNVPLLVHEGHYYKLTRRLVKHFTTRGAAVIGDAAHTVHPTGGQGMNVGFVDAEQLAHALEVARSGPKSEAQALDAFHRLRLREVRRIQARTHLFGIVGEIVPQWLGTTKWLLSTVDRMTPLKRWLGNRFVNVC